MTGPGSWNAIWIDTLRSKDADAAGPYGRAWDHQMQMTRTPDGSKVFCLWTDTDPLFDPTNVSPDIKARGFDVVSLAVTPEINFTKNDPVFFGDNFWLRVADQVFYDGPTMTSIIPVTTSIPGATGDDPLVHQYFKGLEVPDELFEGIQKSGTQVNHSAVSANYPNPFTGTTEIKINLEKSSSVNLVVTSILGTQISKVNYGMMDKGTHRLKLNCENLTTGVYFYTVNFNGESYTHKMIVK